MAERWLANNWPTLSLSHVSGFVIKMSKETYLLIGLILPFLAIWAGHWFPWRKLIGRDLSRPEAYIYGVTCIIGVPIVILIAYHLWFPVLLVSAGVVGAGAGTLSAYAIDTWAEMRHRNIDLEESLHAQDRSQQ